VRGSIKILLACMAPLDMAGCAWLARHSPLGKAAENYLRPINGNHPHEKLVPGRYVKIVE